MALTVKLSDRIAKLLHLGGPQAERRALEMLAAQGYRSGMLSRTALGQLLELKPDKIMEFLKAHHCAGTISLEGFEDVGEALDAFTTALGKRARREKKRLR